MKRLFATLLSVLLIWAALVYVLQPGHHSSAPVLYWTTDNNPVRAIQIEQFQEWLVQHDYPEMVLRLDTSNADLSKKLIQGVSGVASDLIDLNPSPSIS